MGVSTARAGIASAPPDSGASADPVRAPDVLPRAYAATFRKLAAAPVVSHGHAGGRYVMSVFANDVASAAYDELRGAFPAGSVFVAEHGERTADAARGPIFMMEKRASAGDAGDAGTSAWRYVAIDPKGNVVKNEEGGLCAECHREAPHDSVFPVLP